MEVRLDNDQTFKVPIGGVTSGSYFSANANMSLPNCTFGAPPSPPSPPPPIETAACFLYSSLVLDPSVPFQIIPNDRTKTPELSRRAVSER